MLLALAAFERLGAATLSTDAVVHELLATDEVRGLLVEKFGPEIAPDGQVDRKKVAEQVFGGGDDRREWLEGILWPRVGQRMWDWRTGLAERAEPPRVAVVEVPLLFESGMESGFDATIAVVADESVREERAGARGHAGVASRTARQLSQDEKSQRADFTVRNDGTLDELERNLSEVIGNIEA